MPSNSTPVERRNASADLWLRTLSQIPSVFGRLVYLASLREPNTGRYHHQGLQALFGPDEASRALRLSHNACCREWLRCSLEEQKADLELYLSAQSAGPSEVAGRWLEFDFWRTVLPESIRGAERALFVANVDALLSLLRKGGGDSAAGSTASPLRSPAQ